jgi:hypothetical protein
MATKPIKLQKDIYVSNPTQSCKYVKILTWTVMNEFIGYGHRYYHHNNSTHTVYLWAILDDDDDDLISVMPSLYVPHKYADWLSDCTRHILESLQVVHRKGR